MTEMPAEELSLRDLVDVLRRHLRFILGLPLVAGAVTLLATLLMPNQYESTATASISPSQVRAQLEQKIQVQQTPPVTFEAYRAVVMSREALEEVRRKLKEKGQLPTPWQDERLGLERMAKAFKLKDLSPKQQPAAGETPPPLVVEHRVRAPSPEIATLATNYWVEGAVRRINDLPLARTKAALAALEEQLADSQKRYGEAQVRWEAFFRATTLNQDRAELDAKTGLPAQAGERVTADAELAGLERDLAAVQGRIAAVSREVALQAAVVPVNISPDQIALANKRLQEAKQRLAEETSRVQKRYTQAQAVLEDFKKRERIPQWQAELSAYIQRLSEAGVRLSNLEVELAAKGARLASFQEALGQEPRLLVLEREISADPALLAVIAQGGLAALVGLKLKNQELNPTHLQLFSEVLTLKAELATLAQEKEALRKEQATLQGRIDDLKVKIAAQEREKEAVSIEAAAKKAAYETFRSRYDQIQGLEADVRFDNPNPEYQRLRSVLIDAQAEEARLISRIAALKVRIAALDARINVLKERTAKAQVEADRVNQAVELAKNEYTAVAQKQNDLRIELASGQNSLAQVVAPAYPIYEKVAPRRLLLILLAAVLGGMVAVFWAFLAEALRPRREAAL